MTSTNENFSPFLKLSLTGDHTLSGLPNPLLLSQTTPTHSFLVSYHHHLSLPLSTSLCQRLSSSLMPTWLNATLRPLIRRGTLKPLRCLKPSPSLFLLIPCPLLRLLLPSGRRAAPPRPPLWTPLLAPPSRQFLTFSTSSVVGGSSTATTLLPTSCLLPRTMRAFWTG